MSNVNSLLSPLVNQQIQSLTQNLSKDQLTKLNDILSQYDGKNFTQKDFEKLGKQLQDAGIPPGKQASDAIKAKGIDVTPYLKHASQAGAGKAGGTEAYGPAYTLDLSNPAQKISAQSSADNGPRLTDDQKKTIQSIFDKYKDAPKTKETFDKVHDELKAAGVAPEQVGGAEGTAQAGGPPGGKPPQGKTPPSGGGAPAGGGGVTYDQATDDEESSKRKVRPKVGSSGADEVVDKDGNINQRKLKQLIEAQEAKAHQPDTK